MHWLLTLIIWGLVWLAAAAVLLFLIAWIVLMWIDYADRERLRHMMMDGDTAAGRDVPRSGAEAEEDVI